MTWKVTQRPDLPNWDERPWFTCFPDVGAWDAEEKYAYANERYYTESFFSTGGQLCGVWVTTLDLARGAQGVADVYDATDGELSTAEDAARMDREFQATIDECLRTGTLEEIEHCKRAREAAASTWDAPGYEAGVYVGETAKQATDALGKIADLPWKWILGIGAAVVAVAYIGPTLIRAGGAVKKRKRAFSAARAAAK